MKGATGFGELFGELPQLPIAKPVRRCAGNASGWLPARDTCQLDHNRRGRQAAATAPHGRHHGLTAFAESLSIVGSTAGLGPSMLKISSTTRQEPLLLRQ